MTASNTVLQTIVEEDKRGRIMSLFTMVVTGLAPIGGLLAGQLADQVGAAVALRLAGLACVAAALAFAVQYPRLRAQALPVYIRKGIVAEPVVLVAGRFSTGVSDTTRSAA